MENRKSLMIVIVLLVIALLVVSVYLFKSRLQISELESGQASVIGAGKMEKSSPCENVVTPEDQAACMSELNKIAETLQAYEASLMGSEEMMVQ